MILQGIFQTLSDWMVAPPFFISTPIPGVSWSNLTVAYFSNGLVQPPNQLHDSHHLYRESPLRRCLGVQTPTLWHPNLLYPNFSTAGWGSLDQGCGWFRVDFGRPKGPRQGRRPKRFKATDRKEVLDLKWLGFFANKNAVEISSNSRESTVKPDVLPEIPAK